MLAGSRKRCKVGDYMAAGDQAPSLPSRDPTPGTAEGERLHGGELNAAVTSAMVGIHTKSLGRGPESASMFYHGNVIVTSMYGALTHAKKTLNATSQGEAVNQIRHLLQGNNGG